MKKLILSWPISLLTMLTIVFSVLSCSSDDDDYSDGSSILQGYWVTSNANGEHDALFFNYNDGHILKHYDCPTLGANNIYITTYTWDAGSNTIVYRTNDEDTATTLTNVSVSRNTLSFRTPDGKTRSYTKQESLDYKDGMNLSNGMELSDEVVNSPENHDFKAVDATHITADRSIHKVKVWSYGDGIFLTANSQYAKKYYKWRKMNTEIKTKEGQIELKNQYCVTIGSSDNKETVILGTDHELLKVGFSSGSWNLDATAHNCYDDIDVYDDHFSHDQINISFTATWPMLNTTYSNSIVQQKDATHDHYTVRIWWYCPANYSSYDRDCYVVVTFRNVGGKDYTKRIHATQNGSGGSSGDDSGDDSGGSGGGDGWVPVSATGYLPYWYCPTDGDYTPSNPYSHPDRNVEAYKNTSTGRYKVVYSGKEYSAHRGKNKVTIDRQYHSTYNSRYGYWGSCTDYCYYEFTIND